MAEALPGPTPVIGFISATSMDADTSLIIQFRRQLNEISLIDGRTVGIEFRFAEYRLERLLALAADLVSRPARSNPASSSQFPTALLVRAGEVIAGLGSLSSCRRRPTAKAIGLNVPASVLLRADELIE